MPFDDELAAIAPRAPAGFTDAVMARLGRQRRRSKIALGVGGGLGASVVALATAMMIARVGSGRSDWTVVANQGLTPALATGARVPIDTALRIGPGGVVVLQGHSGRIIASTARVRVHADGLAIESGVVQVSGAVVLQVGGTRVATVGGETEVEVRLSTDMRWVAEVLINAGWAQVLTPGQPAAAAGAGDRARIHVGLPPLVGRRNSRAFALAALAPAPPPAPTPAALNAAMDVAGAPVRGPGSARVTLVIFSDFECPFCGRAAATVELLQKAFPDDLRVAFRHFPLPFHPNAALAAEAAMAAHAQGKFWQMHDRLFADTRRLGPADLRRHAATVGLDLARFDAALEARTFKADVEADARRGADAGFTGTPSFLMNGRRIVGAVPFESLKRDVEQALSRQ